MTSITLYTTVGCHLCELADTLLREISLRRKISLEPIEIGDNDELVTLYGTTIPVLKFDDNSELHWPFSQLDVEQKINQLQSN